MRWVLASVLALALLAPGAADAQSPPKLPVGEAPLGTAEGVRLVVDDGSIVLVFSHRAAKLRRRINSRYAWMECSELGEGIVGSFGGNLDVPRHGRRVNTGFGRGDADYCRFFLRAHKGRHGHRVSRRLLFSLSLSQAGAVYLDEEIHTISLIRVGLVIELAKEKLKLTGSPTYAQVLQAFPRAEEILAPLAAPGDTPPYEQIGYYSDGKEHTVVAIVSTLGRRLFIERSAGDVLTTNVSEHLFDDWIS